MAQTAAFTKQWSVKMNKALSSIGVNDEIIKSRRKSYLQIECNDPAIRRCSLPLFEHPFYLGSQTEGTTTLGLKSDTDYVFCVGDKIIRVIQNVATQPVELQMIKSPNPGYCFLRDDFESGWFYKDRVNRYGKSFVKNTFQVYNDWFGEKPEMEGPAIIFQTADGYFINCLWAFPGTSWPDEVRFNFFLGHNRRTWPKKHLTYQVVQSLCFVVPKGSGIGKNADIEWRISFSIGERLLMFDLNVVQIRCYILMKYIKATFLDTIDGCKGVVSSYICKTAMFHVISQTPNTVWIEEELLTNLNHCLSKLRKFKNEYNCPHFIMPTNNLFANKLDSTQRSLLSTELDRIIASHRKALYGVKIDNFGVFLQSEQEPTFQLELSIKMSLIHTVIHHLTASWLKANNANNAWHEVCKNEWLMKSEEVFIFEMDKLTQFCRTVTDQRMIDAVKMVICRKSTMIGSCLASNDFRLNRGLSVKAFQWLLLGVQCSDAASSYLKLASILFSDGDMECTEIVLNDLSKKIMNDEIDTFCICQRMNICSLTFNCVNAFLAKKEFTNILREHVGFCLTFLRCEIKCCPKELQYEMFRTTFCDQNALPKEHSSYTERLYNVNIPPKPFLHFLQYKLYKQLGMEENSLISLYKLENLAKGPRMAELHRETIWNLVAQCMEQEGQATSALDAYKRSIILQPNYNAGRVLLCCYLNRQFQLRNSSRE